MKGLFTENYGFDTQILGMVEPKMVVSVTVSEALGKADGNKKIVKAGTPLSGDLLARETAFTGTGTAVGILLKDADVTHGDIEAPLLIFGCVNIDRLDTETAALITDEVKTALNGKIFFIKD